MREGIKFKTSALCTNYLLLKVALTRHQTYIVATLHSTILRFLKIYFLHFVMFILFM